MHHISLIDFTNDIIGMLNGVDDYAYTLHRRLMGLMMEGIMPQIKDGDELD